jgi:hypothetical protein
MIAMVATMIIAGAVFKLMSAGNSAFRREPAMADRQQQVRMAMNVLAEDIMRTGHSMPPFLQVFKNNLDGVGATGATGQPTDEIEMLTSSDCPVLSVCDSPGTNVVTREELSDCYALPNVVFLIEMDPPSAGVFWAEKPGKGKVASCGGGGAKNGHVNLPPGQSDMNYPGGPGLEPDFMLIGAVARYRINVDAGGTPNLERSPTGGLDKNGAPWQTIARGIEDLQVEYLTGAGWSDVPGTVSCGGTCANPSAADYDTLVRKVRIRLSARSLTDNLQGATTSAVGDAVRGELVSEFVPRAAMLALNMGDGEV